MTGSTKRLGKMSREERREHATQEDADRAANRDPLSHAAGAHPIGTAAGAAGGAVTGAIAGSELAGPVGLAVGGVVGAVVGAVTGHGVAEEMNETDVVTPRLRAPKGTGLSMKKKPIILIAPPPAVAGPPVAHVPAAAPENTPRGGVSSPVAVHLNDRMALAAKPNEGEPLSHRNRGKAGRKG